MLTWLKSILAELLPLTLYAVVVVTSIVAIARRAQWGLYLLVVLTPLPVVWYRLHDLPFGNSTLDVLILATFAGVLVNKKGFESGPAGWLVGTYMLVAYLALWNATLRFDLPYPFTLESPLLADWKNYAEMIALYFLAYNAIRDDDELRTVFMIMAIVFLLIVTRSARNFDAGEAFSYDRRAEGPFWIVGLGANHFGAFVAHYGSLLLGVSLVDRAGMRKWLCLAAAVIGLHPLFFAYSRGAYLGALTAVTLYGLLKKRVLLVVVAFVMLAWQVVLPTTVVERISMTESNGVIEESADLRLGVWEHAMQLFEDNPVFGVGFDGFAIVRAGERLTDTHNFFLKTAAEQGVVGLVALAAILLRATTSAWRLYRRGHAEFHRGLGLGFLGCCVAVAVTNVFGDRWSYFALGGYFWIFWGLVDRAIRISDASTSRVSRPVDTRRAVPTAR